MNKPGEIQENLTSLSQNNAVVLPVDAPKKHNYYSMPQFDYNQGLEVITVHTDDRPIYDLTKPILSQEEIQLRDSEWAKDMAIINDDLSNMFEW
jgi:hypothetical protein